MSKKLPEVVVVNRDDTADVIGELAGSVTCLLVYPKKGVYSLCMQTQEYFARTCSVQDREGGLLDERPEPVLVVPEAGIDEQLICRVLGGMSFGLLHGYLVPQRFQDEVVC